MSYAQDELYWSLFVRHQSVWANIQGLGAIFFCYFGHNYEVFWGLFCLQYISYPLNQIRVASKFLWEFNIEVAPKPEMLERPACCPSVH